MHVAIAIPHLGGGGAERSALRIARGLIERGHIVDMLLFRADIHYRDQVHEKLRIFSLDVNSDKLTHTVSGDLVEKVVPLPASWWEGTLFSKAQNLWRLGKILRYRVFTFMQMRVLRRAGAFACYINQEKPDCIIANLQGAESAAMLARHLANLYPPLIMVVRGDNKYRRSIKRFRYDWLLQEADFIVAVSDGVADSLADVPGLKKDITTIYNPAAAPEINRLAPLPPEHPWMLDNDLPVVLAVGRLNWQKDFPTLLRAFAQLFRQYPARLVILGEGPERTALETLVQELGLETCVSFAGWVENPFAFMARADLFVLSSVFEGLPNVLIEALACGCPVVSTDCPSGPAEILQNGKIGPLVPVGNVEALADAMLRVLQNPPERKLLQHRVADFSFDKAIDRYEKLIVDAVG